MSEDLEALARVRADYRAPYPDPIRVDRGDEVVIDSSKKTDWRGWVWCTDRVGRSGWVPEAYLERDGNLGHMRCDYDAIELSIRTGEMLTCHKLESGFFWATNQAGQRGWVPASHIELISKGDP